MARSARALEWPPILMAAVFFRVWQLEKTCIVSRASIKQANDLFTIIEVFFVAVCLQSMQHFVGSTGPHLLLNICVNLLYTF